MKKVGIYARTGAGDEQCLESQIETFRDFIAELEGYSIVEDAVIKEQATNTTTRTPGLEKLMEWARERTIDAVYITSLDKLSRDIEAVKEYRQKLQEYGVLLFVLGTC